MKKFITYILLVFVSLPLLAQNVRTFIPPNAYQFLPVVKSEGLRIMPELTTPHYFAGLIEHESCISLRHSRCWSATSELRSQRERGVGLGQLTKTFREDGSIRFDTLSDMRRANMRELSELSWSNITQRPDLQIRTIILMINRNYDSLFEIPDQQERLAMADVGYNAGLRRVSRNRLQCSLTKGCDASKWFYNAENHCTASRKPLYAGRSACDIMNHHPRDVLFVRMPKYEIYFR